MRRVEQTPKTRFSKLKNTEESTWAKTLPFYLKTMKRLPDVVVLVDQRRESNAVLEARKLDIPLISMLDTNCDPDLCEVPIPCNDDAVRSVQLVLGRLADAINEGRHGSNEQRSRQKYS